VQLGDGVRSDMASEERRAGRRNGLRLVTGPRLVHVWYLPRWKGFFIDGVVVAIRS